MGQSVSAAERWPPGHLLLAAGLKAGLLVPSPLSTFCSSWGCVGGIQKLSVGAWESPGVPHLQNRWKNIFKQTD